MNNGLFSRLSRHYRDLRGLEELMGKGVIGNDETMVIVWLYRRIHATAGELAQGLCYSPSKVSRCAKKLLIQSLIVERADDADRRVCLYELSQRGINVAFELVRFVGEAELADLLDDFVALRAAAIGAGLSRGASIGEVELRVVLLLRTAGPASGSSATGLSVGELAEFAATPQPGVSMCLNALRCRGIVDCEKRSGGDRRIRRFELTQDGAQTADRVLEHLFESGRFFS